MSKATEQLKALMAKLDQAKGIHLETQRVIRAYRRELSDLRDVLDLPPSRYGRTTHEQYFRR